MTQQQVAPNRPPNPPPPIRLSEADEVATCRHVAELEIAGDYFAACILRDEYDLDDVWIEDIKAEIQGNY